MYSTESVHSITDPGGKLDKTRAKVKSGRST